MVGAKRKAANCVSDEPLSKTRKTGHRGPSARAVTDGLVLFSRLGRDVFAHIFGFVGDAANDVKAAVSDWGAIANTCTMFYSFCIDDILHALHPTAPPKIEYKLTQRQLIDTFFPVKGEFTFKWQTAYLMIRSSGPDASPPADCIVELEGGSTKFTYVRKVHSQELQDEIGDPEFSSHGADVWMYRYSRKNISPSVKSVATSNPDMPVIPSPSHQSGLSNWRLYDWFARLPFESYPTGYFSRDMTIHPHTLMVPELDDKKVHYLTEYVVLVTDTFGTKLGHYGNLFLVIHY